MKDGKTAILIFANSAEKEITTKSFSSKQVFEVLNNKTYTIAKNTGLPFFIYSEKQQVGQTFGERFTNAIQSVYNKGFDTVITIGNDTPHLTSKHITKAVNKLKKHDVVLGPSTDGGFYLMGFKKAHFNTNTFLNLPWQTTKLNRNLTKLIASTNLKTSYLEPLTDIDTLSDIKTVLSRFKILSKTIKRLLVKLFSFKKKIATYIRLGTYFSVTNQYLNKGSPIYSSYQ